MTKIIKDDPHWYPDDPDLPYNTDHLHKILGEGDRVAMMRFFKTFQMYSYFDGGTPRHWQQFIGKILVMAARNPGDEILELGLSKNTVTHYRNELVTTYTG